MKVWATIGIATCIGLALAWLAPVAMAQEAPVSYGKFSASGDGVVVPARSWDISAEVPNQIKKIHFVEGQFVKEGDLLVEFDTMFKKLDLQLAELALERAKTDLDKANEQLDRKRKLGPTASKVELRDSILDARLAEANAKEAEILLEKAKTILKVQKIYAPFDGQVSAPLFRDNANVNSAEDSEIATLVQLDPIHVRVQGTHEKLQSRVSEGRTEAGVRGLITLVIELPDGTKYPYTGRLLTTAFSYDTKTGFGTGIAEFPNPERVLRPGLKVKVTSYEKSD